MTSVRDREGRESAFVWAVLAIALLWVTVFGVVIAARSDFVGDSFAFLDHLQRTRAWSWADIYFGVHERFWPFYRPLGMDTYFYLGYRLFGLDPFGYLLVSLGVHLLTGLVVFRIGRQLGLRRLYAAIAGVLCVSRHPSISLLPLPQIFHYVSAFFFGALTISTFLDYARTHRARERIASCLFFVLALWSNELTITLPTILLVLELRAKDAPISAGAIWVGIRRLAPQIAILGVFLLVRFTWLAPRQLAPGYYLSLGWHIPLQYWKQLVHVAGGEVPLLTAAVLVGGIAFYVLTRGGSTSETRSWFLRTTTAILIWAGIALAPFALFIPPALRFALVLGIPVSLLVATCCDAFDRVAPRGFRRWRQASLAALILLAIPYATLWTKATDPEGRQLREFLELIRFEAQGSKRQGEILVLYGAEGLADPGTAVSFRASTYSGAALRVWFGRRYRMQLVDLGAPPPEPRVAPSCLFVSLLPGMRTEATDPQTLERILPSGPQSLCSERQTPRRSHGG